MAGRYRPGASAVGTLVERQTRYLMLLHLPADHRAETVRDAIAATITTLPTQLRRTLTWDQGVELAQHAQLTIDTGLEGPQRTTTLNHQPRCDDP